MNVADKVNYLLEEQEISKRDFAQKLLSLSPVLDRTGKPPSESTVYGYLNGGREIKIELVPYIAEALNITEQELFCNDIEYANDYNYKHSKEAREILDLLKYAPRGAIEDVRNYLMKYRNVHNEGIKRKIWKIKEALKPLKFTLNSLRIKIYMTIHIISINFKLITFIFK